MTLRGRIMAIVGALTLAFVVAVLALQVRGLRASVQEETIAANRVANQLLDRTAWLYASQGTPAMLAFLEGLGRIRSNDVLLFDREGRQLYRSPSSTYKAGRSAPVWFSALIAPEPMERQIDFPDGRLEVHSEASRAVLDAWDDLLWLVAVGVTLLVLAQLLAFRAVGQAVRPFDRIVTALRALQAGQLDTRLPPLPGREASAMGQAFNRMAEEMQRHIAAERRAAVAERQLHDSRELAQWLQRHIEAERRMIARELHDELGQSVTAIRSMALSVAQRSAGRDAGNEQAARLIADEAGRLYDAMHGIIPRLTPLVLDPFGLNEALADLAERSRRSHPELTLSVRSAVGDQPLAPDAALTLYRAAQEGITNALRHGGATAIELTVQRDDQGIDLSVTDNGCGLQGDHLVASDPGPDHGAVEGEEASPPRGATPEPDVGDERQHHGLRSLRERALALGGHLRLQPRSPADGSGTELRLWLPPLPLAATGSSASALDPAGPAHVPPAAPARPGDKASSDPTDSG